MKFFMAQRKFLLVQRNSAIRRNNLIFSLLLLSLTHAGFAVGERIDNGGISVPVRLERGIHDSESRTEHDGGPTADDIIDGFGYDTFGQNPLQPHPPGRVIALRNRPLRLRCPIKVAENTRVLGNWWTKDGHRLELPTNGQGRVQLQGMDIVFEKIVHKIGSGKEHGRMGGNPNNFPTGGEGPAGAGGNVLNRHQNYSDEGSYDCYVKTSVGVVFSPMIHLAVAGFEMSDHEEELEKRSGEWIVVKCPITSVPKGTVSWAFVDENNNNRTIGLGDERVQMLSSGNLLLKDLRASDSGTYRCSVWNEILRRERKSDMKLTVNDATEVQGELSVAPQFLETYERKHIVLEPEESVALDCVAFGIPLPRITWVLTAKHDNSSTSQPLSNILSDGKTGFDRIYLTPGNLTISGNYSCLVTNGIGPTLTTTLQVSRFPILRQQLESQQSPPAKLFRLKCPVPESFYLLWYKDGEVLHTDTGRIQSRGNNLVVSNTIRNDSGFYQCEVLADQRVYAVGTARLFVNSGYEQPNAPADIECTAISAVAVNVTWSSKPLSDFQAFTVHYSAEGELERQGVTTKANYLIETLKPHTNYTIYVRLYSRSSASGQSQKVYCTTLEDVPTNTPIPLTFERFGPASHIRVKWKSPSNTDARGIIVIYKIQWRSVPGLFTNVRYLDGSAVEFLITGLEPEKSYEVRVIPATAKGYPVGRETLSWYAVPPKSETLDADSTPGSEAVGSLPSPELEKLYEAPSLELTVLNATTLFVRWYEKESRPNVIPKGFRLTYSTYAPNIEDVVYYGPIYVYDYDVRDYLITNLDTATTYEFSVQAFGEMWESDLSSASVRMPTSSGETENTLPMITGLRALPISSSVIRLSWDPLKLAGNTTVSLPHSYVIKYNRVDSSDYDFIRSDAETVDIGNLLPYTSYEFVVSYDDATIDDSEMDDSHHYQDMSLKIEARTLSGIPGPPAGLDYKSTSNQSITVSWSPPPRPNGVVQQYWVEYTDSTSTTVQEAVMSGASTNLLDRDKAQNWTIVSTNVTWITISNLTANRFYLVRVRAETAAGIGPATEPKAMRIFLGVTRSGNNPAPSPKNPEEPGDDPGLPGGRIDFPNKQHLGIILGSSISLCCFIICVTIFVFRNRCFPYFSRSRSRSRTSRADTAYANGNGHGPRWKRSVESMNGVEMKTMTAQTYTPVFTDDCLDTKGGNVQLNGTMLISGPSQDGVSDPLLMRIVRNPMEHRHDEIDLDGQLNANQI